MIFFYFHVTHHCLGVYHISTQLSPFMDEGIKSAKPFLHGGSFQPLLFLFPFSALFSAELYS